MSEFFVVLGENFSRLFSLELLPSLTFGRMVGITVALIIIVLGLKFIERCFYGKND